MEVTVTVNPCPAVKHKYRVRVSLVDWPECRLLQSVPGSHTSKRLVHGPNSDIHYASQGISQRKSGPCLWDGFQEHCWSGRQTIKAWLEMGMSCEVACDWPVADFRGSADWCPSGAPGKPHPTPPRRWVSHPWQRETSPLTHAVTSWPVLLLELNKPNRASQFTYRLGRAFNLLIV